jgi:phosphatidylglycerophosphate synthase
MKNQRAAATAISSLRLIALPLFSYLYSTENITACLILLAFSAFTDFFDGYAARRFRATSTFGAYYDATTDFVLMVGIFTIFTVKAFYPLWVVILMTASFIQFIVTSKYCGKLYDPVGRYLGSALYIGIALTLLFPAQTIFNFVQFAFLGFVLASIISRIISFSRKRV